MTARSWSAAVQYTILNIQVRQSKAMPVAFFALMTSVHVLHINLHALASVKSGSAAYVHCITVRKPKSNFLSRIFKP